MAQMSGETKLLTATVAESVATYPPVSTTVRTISCVPMGKLNEVISRSSTSTKIDPIQNHECDSDASTLTRAEQMC
jgi:hypothetical protein